jgi:uncharacterized delta-60 repeat protein
VLVACSPPRPDATFGDGGYAQVGALRVGWGPERVVVQPDGKILTLVSAEDGSNSVLVVRQLADGGLDTGFGNGRVLTTGMTGGVQCRDIELLADGTILLSGIDGSLNFSVWRFAEDGTRDMSFGTDGGAALTGRGVGVACEIALQSDGAIVAGGNVSGVPLVARFTAGGSLDAGFGAAGVVEMTPWQHPFENVAIRDLVVRPNGRIVAGGDLVRVDSDQPESMVLTQLTTSGAIDTAFGQAGTATHTLGGGLADLVLRPNGRIVAVGSSSRYAPHGHDQFLIAQLTTAGALDTSFGQAGISTAGDGTMARSAALLDDGSLVVAGRDYPREGGFKGPDGFILAKWTPTGTLDTAFGTSGVAAEDRFAGPEAGYAIAAGPDGKLVVAGEVPDTTGSPLNRYDLGVYRFERP